MLGFFPFWRLFFPRRGLISSLERKSFFPIFETAAFFSHAGSPDRAFLLDRLLPPEKLYRCARISLRERRAMAPYTRPSGTASSFWGWGGGFGLGGVGEDALSLPSLFPRVLSRDGGLIPLSISGVDKDTFSVDPCSPTRTPYFSSFFLFPQSVFQSRDGLIFFMVTGRR